MTRRSAEATRESDLLDAREDQVARLLGAKRLALEAAKGQSAVGSWGHGFARPDGRLGGYGMMNSPGVPLTISLVMARAAGVNDPEVARAIERSDTVGPLTSMPCDGEMPSDRYSPAGRPLGVAQTTRPIGTWRVTGIQRNMND